MKIEDQKDYKIKLFKKCIKNFDIHLKNVLKILLHFL